MTLWVLTNRVEVDAWEKVRGQNRGCRNKLWMGEDRAFRTKRVARRKKVQGKSYRTHGTWREVPPQN